MKKHVFPLALVLLSLSSCLPSTTHASGTDSPDGAMLQTEHLGLLGAGIVWEKEQRGVRSPGGRVDLMQAQHIYGLLSLDTFRWLTLIGGAGQSEIKAAAGSEYGDGSFMWTAGARMNLWRHEVVDPSFMASILRLQSYISYWSHEAGSENDNNEWNEVRADLTLRAELLADHGWLENEEVPYSAVFFVGPVYSSIASQREFGPEITEDENLGVMFGVDIKLARKFSVGIEARMFDDPTYAFNAGFHF